MKIFKPRKETVQVTFLLADGSEAVRPFTLREGRRPVAARFQELLEEMTGAGSSMAAKVYATTDDVFRLILAHPEDGEAVTDEELAGLTPSVQEALLDLQGELFGFPKEEKVGGKLRPLLDAIYRLRSIQEAAETKHGSILSTLSAIDTSSTPSESSESGPIDRSTTTTDSAVEPSGEKLSSNSD